MAALGWGRQRQSVFRAGEVTGGGLARSMFIPESRAASALKAVDDSDGRLANLAQTSVFVS